MSLHGEHVLAAVERGDATSPVAASWRRSATVYQLDPDCRAGPERDALALREALERDARLVAVAEPYLDAILDALADPEGGVLIADRHGRILSLRSGRTHDAWKRRAWLWIGTDVSEQKIGTNGTGTALVEQRSVAVRGGEHFLSAIVHTTCFAAPIFAPDGSIVGCLNAMTSGTSLRDPRLETFVRMAVSAFARRIEIELFAAAFSKAKLVLASAAGRSPGALLAVDQDDVVIGATRRARQILDLSDAQIANGLDFRSLGGVPRQGRLEDAERKLIGRTLARHAGNMSAAAREIGISRSTLYRKLSRLHVKAATKEPFDKS